MPGSLQHVRGTWHAALAGYSTPGVGSTRIGYLLAGVVGVALVAGLAGGAAAFLARRRDVPGDAVASGRRARGRSLARRTADAIARSISEVLENEELASGPACCSASILGSSWSRSLLLAVAVSLVHSVVALVALILVTAVLALASHVPVSSFLRKVWLSAGLLAFVIALPSAFAWFTPGRALLSVGPLTLTAPGVLGRRHPGHAGHGGHGLRASDHVDHALGGRARGLSALRFPDVAVATLAMTQKQALTLLRTVEQIHLARESRTLTLGTTRGNREWVTDRMAYRRRQVDEDGRRRLRRHARPRLHRRDALAATPARRARRLVWLAASLAICALALAADKVVR